MEHPVESNESIPASNHKEDESDNYSPHDDEFGQMCCDPRKKYFRFGGLFFMCLLGFGSYFCYDTPGSLQDQIKDDMEVTTYEFASLYALYSWPNVVLCFVGGFLIDRIFGIRLGTIIFSTILTIGQFAYAFGALIDKFWMMQLGRFIFGIGGESLAVAQNAYTVCWFKGRELNTVFGLQLSMARVGSTVNFLTMGPIYSAFDKTEEGHPKHEGHVTLGISLMIAASTCIFSLGCALFLGLMDRRRSKVLRLDEITTGEKIQLKDILSFPLSFWLITCVCVTYYVAIFPFIGLAKVFFMRKYDFGEAQANGVSSIVYIISAIGSPFFGFVVDKTGRNIMWVFFAVLFSLGSHCLLAFTYINPFIPMVILGMAYSLLASSLWPMVSLILPDHKLGTAYGIMQSIQNLGLALISMLGGLIVDTKGYFCLEIFYILWLCLALTCCAGMWTNDAVNEGYLMMSPSQREMVDEENRKYDKVAKSKDSLKGFDKNISSD